MKIGIIIRNLLAQDGGTRIALSVAQEFKNIGHQVTVYAVGFDPEKTYADLLEGINVVAFPPDFKLKYKPLFGLTLPGMSVLGAYLHDHKLARMLADKIDPETEFLNPHSSRISYLTAHYFKKKKKVPVVWQMNDIGLLVWNRCIANLREPDATCSALQRIFYSVIDWFDTKFYLSSVDTIAVLNDETKSDARKYLNRDSVVVRAGVDSKFFTYREHQPISGKRVELMSFAQFVPHRRFEDGVEAVKILLDRGYDPRYTLLGDSETYRPYREYRDRLVALAEKLGVSDRVTFPGRPPQEQARELMHNSHIFVHTNYLQTWGLVVFEAMSTGIPVVLSRGAGAHEVLTDGVQALMVPPKDPPEIATAVEKLIADPTLYQCVGKSGAEFVRRDITWRNYAEGILKWAKSQR